MLKRVITAMSAGALACGCVAAVASGEIIPPKKSAVPTATNGKRVSIVATGLGTPTSFAFGGGAVFEGDGGPEGMNGPTGPGGVFVLKGGKATLLNGSPPFVAGVAYRNGTLFVSAAFANKKGVPVKEQILAWSGWNGTTFKARRAIYTAPKKFPGFNGLAIGPDGRLYVGVDVSLTRSNDHGPAKAPYQYDILSMDLKGKHLKVFASGMRQPWQIAFAKGSKAPFVTDFGQDAPPGIKVPDLVLHVHQGDNYGFPQCTWAKPKAKVCKGFTKPFELFKAHTDLGGIGAIGNKLYLSTFGYGSHPAAVVTLPIKGGALKTLVSGFNPGEFVIGLGVHNGWVYFGTTTGNVYRVHS